MSHESIAKAASTATYTGATMSVSSAAAQTVIPPGMQDTILGLSLNEWTVLGIVFGMLMAAVGLVVNWIYKQKHFQLAKSRIDEVLSDGD